MNTLSRSLLVTNIPPRGASWEKIVTFANQLERYLPRNYSELARKVGPKYGETGRWQGTLTELICHLYGEHRAFHHYGRYPEGDELASIYDLLHAIRSKVTFPPLPKQTPKGTV